MTFDEIFPPELRKEIPEDIIRLEREYPHGKILRITNEGMWGQKVQGLFTLVYECVSKEEYPVENEYYSPCWAHRYYGPKCPSHNALYGPHIAQFAKGPCSVCGVEYGHDENIDGHKYEPSIQPEILDWTKYTLYAD